MPVNTVVIGRSTEPLVHEVDARWTMAYSAGLGDRHACYLDTTREDGVVAHPLFSIAPEWPVVLDARDLLKAQGLTESESRRSVHATHDLHVHRLVRPGDRLYTQATFVSMEERRPGAFTVLRLDTSDELGRPIATTFQGGLYRDVELAGEAQRLEGVPEPPSRLGSGARAIHTSSLPIEANLAHVYTECARIWNPIHTDVAVARAAGLPDIILHGSATLALAVSQIVEHAADGDPRHVRRLAGAFRGMVLMPSDIEVRIFAAQPGDPEGSVRFDVLNADGRPAIADGLVVLDAREL